MGWSEAHSSRYEDMKKEHCNSSLTEEISIARSEPMAIYLHLSWSMVITAALWNRNYFLLFQFRYRLLKSYGSGSNFWKVMVPVPVPTVEKLRLRFRFRFQVQLHI